MYNCVSPQVVEHTACMSRKSIKQILQTRDKALFCRSSGHNPLRNYPCRYRYPILAIAQATAKVVCCTIHHTKHRIAIKPVLFNDKSSISQGLQPWERCRSLQMSPLVRSLATAGPPRFNKKTKCDFFTALYSNVKFVSHCSATLPVTFVTSVSLKSFRPTYIGICQ